MARRYRPQTKLGRVVNEIEETLIAGLLGVMTLIAFFNVVARYVFNSNILWALETQTFLFAWLTLLGAAYLVKITAHLGVDAVINLCSPPTRRIVALVALACCLVFSVLMLIGSWNYWAPFANLPELGWFFGAGEWRDQGWYETSDIPMFEWLRFVEPTMNAGEHYEKLPRFIPYFILPLGSALLLFRFIEAGFRLWRGEETSLIVSHEAEEEDSYPAATGHDRSS